MRRSTRRFGARSGALAAIGALAFALILSGCANDSLAEQYRSGSGKGYISGSGVTELTPAQRGEPVTFSGVTETGEKVSSKNYLGEVLVVNFWYAQCGPCRIEAPDLETASQKFEGEGASFLGVNTRDQADTALSFAKTYSIGYPSILDVDGGAVQLAFQGSMRPNATPTTLVLDKKGRVAARIEGPITEQPSTLDALIRDTIAEKE